MENNTARYPENDLDEIDYKIITFLREDGRMAFAQIAHQLKVSAGMVRVRYNRLVEMGYLHVFAITNPLRLGFRTMAFIGIHTEGSQLLKVSEQISTLEEVIYMVITSGRYDIIAEIICRDQADMLHFLSEKLYKIDGVQQCESFMHLKIAKETYF